LGVRQSSIGQICRGNENWVLQQPHPGPRILPITLEVLSVKVERLQDITMEGMAPEGKSTWIALWNHHHAKRGYGWDANPWVWVVEFERVEG
jgi:hypothetical protein